MRLIIINSTGPMASTVLGALIEKFGFLNLPIRKRGITACLLNTSNENKEFFVNRTVDQAYEMARFRKGGGPSVVIRNTAKPQVRLDINLIKDDLNAFAWSDNSSMHELFHSSMKMFSKGIVYKDVNKDYKGSIEYLIDLMKFDSSEVMDAYNNEFMDVKCFHMYRDFISWINSLAAQRMCRKSFRVKNYIFRLSSLIKRHEKYESVVKKLPGMHVKFDELFIPNTKNIVSRIGEYLNEEVPNIEWEKELFDIYGLLCDYEKTFTILDDKTNYLSERTKRFAISCYNSRRRNIFSDIIFNLMFLIDYTIFRRKNSYILK